jgi:hypothetical protein
MRRVIVTNRADAEFMRAIGRYNEKVPGLGDRFRVGILQAFDRIAQSPERFRHVSGDVQRAVVKIFPFVILLLLKRIEL